jgi:hypothetical protein
MRPMRFIRMGQRNYGHAAMAATLAFAAAFSATPAAAQLVGQGLPLPALPGVGAAAGDPTRPADGLVPRPRVLLDPAEGALAAGGDLAGGALTELRARTIARLLRDHRAVLDTDEEGSPVVRGEVLALAPGDGGLQAAQRAGFRVLRRETLSALGLETVVLGAPRGISTREALRRLRAADPAGEYEFNHLFQASGAVAPAVSGGPPRVSGGGAGRLGLVDGSVLARHPALRSAQITQRPFAPGGARVTDHATAVASLMVGSSPRVAGGAPGAVLFVADVYGPTPAGGSAEAIARGLSWLAENDASVINISLVGPSNRLMASAIAALVARGHTVVAAVGNDGPAAPPLYPAAYPGVVAVTGVDGRRRVLIEAGRGPHVDFAAPGAEMSAAGKAGGYLSVRGTSFAAPLVAGMIARAARGDPIGALAAEAVDLGAPGQDPVYGRGLVGFSLRVPADNRPGAANR